MILRKPNCVVGETRLTTASRLLAVSDAPAGGAILEVGQQPENVLLAVEWDLAAFGAQALAQQDSQKAVASINWTLPRRSGRFRLVSTQT